MTLPLYSSEVPFNFYGELVVSLIPGLYIVISV